MGIQTGTIEVLLACLLSTHLLSLCLRQPEIHPWRVLAFLGTPHTLLPRESLSFSSHLHQRAPSRPTHPGSCRWRGPPCPPCSQSTRCWSCLPVFPCGLTSQEAAPLSYLSLYPKHMAQWCLEMYRINNETSSRQVQTRFCLGAAECVSSTVTVSLSASNCYCTKWSEQKLQQETRSRDSLPCKCSQLRGNGCSHKSMEACGILGRKKNCS